MRRIALSRAVFLARRRWIGVYRVVSGETTYSQKCAATITTIPVEVCLTDPNAGWSRRSPSRPTGAAAVSRTPPRHAPPHSGHLQPSRRRGAVWRRSCWRGSRERNSFLRASKKKLRRSRSHLIGRDREVDRGPETAPLRHMSSPDSSGGISLHLEFMSKCIPILVWSTSIGLCLLIKVPFRACDTC